MRIEVTSVQWSITIKDDGIGMQTSEVYEQGKFGLRGMENRIKALNGAISFHSEAAMGTTVTAYIPRERSIAYV
ncbi:nitrate/nitrite sensor protein NarQ [compost metagenome]